MGWATGSLVYDKIIVAAREAIPDKETRIQFHQAAIAAFEEEDWDTQDECLGLDTAYDEALFGLHPDWNY